MATINDKQSDLESDQTIRLSASQQSILYLWQFIIHMLSDEKYKHIISWTDNENEFEFLDPKEVNQY